MTRAARVAAQAKVNLTLVVGPKDVTGYHEIFTLFQRIELADEIVCPDVRGGFSFAVADAYETWRDVDEDDAAALLGL